MAAGRIVFLSNTHPPEHYDIFRAVEDLADTVDRRVEVGTLLDDLLGDTEERVAAETAAAAAAAAEELAAQTRRPVSELRMIFAKNTPGTGTTTAPPAATAAGGSGGSGSGSGSGSSRMNPASAIRRVASAAGGLIGSKTRAGTAGAAGDGAALGRTARAGSARRSAAAAAAASSGGGGSGSGSSTISRRGSGSGDGGMAGRLKRASPSPVGDRRRSPPRRSSDPTGKLKAAAAATSRAGEPDSTPNDGLSEATRRRLRGMGSSGGISPRPAAAGEHATVTGGAGKKTAGVGGSAGGADPAGGTTAADRRARFARQRSRSLSSSRRRGDGEGGNSDGGGGGNSAVSVSPRPTPAGAVPRGGSGGSRSRPPPLSGATRSSSWGIASGGGRSRSGSPRAASPSSTDGGGASRSQSPVRAGGIPRPRGRGGSGDGGGAPPRALSPRVRFPSAELRQGFASPSRGRGERGAAGASRGGVAGDGDAGGAGVTLSGTAIEAAAKSFMSANESGKSSGVGVDVGGPEQQVSTAPPSVVSGTDSHTAAGGLKAGVGGDGAVVVVEGGADGPGSVGAGTSRPSSRGNSFDSVGDVVVVGGVALGNHRGFPGEDWSQSQPGTPKSSSQVGWVGMGST